jgi:hypothetical protein
MGNCNCTPLSIYHYGKLRLTYTKGAILAIISGALLAGSTHIAVFITFRFIAGAGAFMILAAVPVRLESESIETVANSR